MTLTELFIIIIVVAFIAGIFQAISNSKKEKERGEILSKRASNIDGFVSSTTITGAKNRYQFLVDNENRKVCFIDECSKRIIPFEDIISVELVENGTTLSTKSTIRTVGGTLVGGALAGGAGAIVGGLSGNSKQVQKVSDVQIRMRIRDLENPVLVIKCFDAKTMTIEGKPIKTTSMDGNIYREGRQHAQRILDLVSVIIDDVDRNNVTATTESKSVSNISIADELTKLADLKEKGILSQDEFDQQKAKLLSSQVDVEPQKKVEENVVEIVEPTDDLSPELRQLIDEGKIIQAIKIYKDATGVSLNEAKDFIESHR